MPLPLIAWAGMAAGATLLNGLIQSSAANRAANAQSQANQAATAESARQFNAQLAAYNAEQALAQQRYYETQSALSPYTQTGASAIAQQRALLGLDPDRTGMIAAANAEYNRAVAAANQSRTAQNTQAGASQGEGQQSGLQGALNGLSSAGAPGSGNGSDNGLFGNLLGGGRNNITGRVEGPSKTASTGTFQPGGLRTNQVAGSGGMPNTTTDTEYNNLVAQAAARRDAAIASANALPSGASSQQAAIAAISGGSEMAEMTRQGEEAILQNAAATGGLRGGNTQGALAQFRPSMLNSLVNQQYERLGQLSALGQNSVLGAASGGSSGTVQYPSGANTLSLMQQQGAINAGNALAQGNAYQSIPNAFLAGLGTYAGLGGFN